MATLRKLASLDDRGRWLAFDPSGAAVVDVPSLPAWFRLDRIGRIGTSPLDVMERHCHGAAVAAFERARRTGHGSAHVTLIGEDDAVTLHIVDESEHHGCFFAIALGATDGESAPGASDPLGTRQGTFGTTASGAIEWANESFCRLLGWTEAELVGTSSLDLIHPDDHEAGIIAWIDMLETPGSGITIRQRFRSAGGEWRWCEVTDWNLLDDPDWQCVRTDLVDITRELDALAELQRREALLDRLSRALPTAVLYADVDGTTLVSNDRWEELVGERGTAGLVGLREVVADRDAFDAAMTDAERQGLDIDLEVHLAGDDRSKPGRCEFGDLRLRPLSEDGRALGLLITLDDRTAERRLQHELDRQAHRDPLTGVLNRLGMDRVLGELMTDRTSELALAFLDLDRFKAINDSCGHAAGDAFLRIVADAFQHAVRPSDVIARIGGDEFVAVLAGEGAGAAAERFCADAVELVAELARRHHREIAVGVSVGFAVAGVDDGVDDLLRRADAAMYACKAARREQAGRR